MKKEEKPAAQTSPNPLQGKGPGKERVIQTIVGFVVSASATFLIPKFFEPTTPAIAATVITFLLAATFGLLLIIYGFQFLFARDWRFKIVAGVLILAAMLGALAGYQWYEDKSVPKSFSVLQDSFTEVAVAKEFGNAGNWSEAKRHATKAGDQLRDLSVPARLDDYREALVAWADAVKAASVNASSWKGAPDEPAGFELRLTQSLALDLYGDTVDRLFAAKEFGDKAIAKGDRATMRYIYGKLLAMAFWMNHVNVSSAANLWGSLSVIPSAEAVTIVRGACLKYPNGMNTCLRNTGDHAKNLSRYPGQYAAGKPVKPAEWNEAWKNLVQEIGAQGVPLPSEGGVSQGEPLFLSGCGAQGGTVSNGISQSQVPTLEGGRTCNYGNGCFNALTNSGGSYSGGGSGCKESNVLPKPKPQTTPGAPAPTKGTTPTPTPTPKPGPGSGGGAAKDHPWDGTYGVQASIACVPLGLNVGVIPANFTMTVRSSRVYVSGSQTAPLTINERGVASESQSFTAEGVSTSYTASYNFSGTKTGPATVTGIVSVTIRGQGFTENCNGTASGQRTAP